MKVKGERKFRKHEGEWKIIAKFALALWPHAEQNAQWALWRASMRGMDNRTVHAFLCPNRSSVQSWALFLAFISIMKAEKYILRGGEAPPCIELTLGVLPEVQDNNVAKDSQTGVSTKNALTETSIKSSGDGDKDVPHWYALRSTYGREKKAYDYMTAKNIKAFYPTITSTKLILGKRKQVTESRIPNIFFAYGTEEEIKAFVYDNVNLPFLRFYYRYFSIGGKKDKAPMIIPERQMESLRIICEAETEDIIVTSDGEARKKFEEGQMVRITDGKFKGVVGKVAKYKGQLRVGVVIEGMMTVATAYVPRGFLDRY